MALVDKVANSGISSRLSLNANKLGEALFAHVGKGHQTRGFKINTGMPVAYWQRR